MCGIFGIIASPDSLLTSKDLRAGVLKAFHESERRGKDSSGAMHISTQKIVVTKSPARGKDLIKTKIFQELLAGALNDYERGETFIFFGHTRMATHGSADIDVNNQPVLSDRSVVLHNGIIVNFEEIFETTPELKREHEVDSEIIPLLIDNFRRTGYSEMDSVVKTSKKIVGANTFLYLNSNSNTAYLNSSNGSLYVLENESKGLFAFASEKQTLDKILLEVKYVSQVDDVYQPPRNRPVEIRLSNYNGMSFDASTHRQDVSLEIGRELLNLVASTASTNHHRESFSLDSEAHLPADFHSKLPNFKEIVRCQKCILPTNFPYLGFDENGICDLCQREGNFPQYGTKKLLRDLHSKEGDTYLIPISGGRDSCYALHYVVKELNMKAVAFTYDWGFVTDVARRNISKMCGELGVEHILVAADLKMKRKNVRKNVSAWLKKPHLGMVPLFMAGDKDFFRYASEVKNDLNLSNSLFGMTRFEPAGFKTGFAGIRETNQYEKTFDLGISNKVKLASFYARQSLTNPRYLNSSLADSISGYYSYYLKKMDYLQLFDYVKWNEGTVLSTLFDNYGWETSKHSSNTWRIGDASAPFYNYIYFYFSGLTENDVYLSNLIRDGQVSREMALHLVEDFNKGDEIGFTSYCNLIGLDANLVLKEIHKNPGLVGTKS
jgi:glucosamine--fructose-6-phosphate aminotransferase (isomerizing)